MSKLTVLRLPFGKGLSAQCLHSSARERLAVWKSTSHLRTRHERNFSFNTIGAGLQPKQTQQCLAASNYHVSPNGAIPPIKRVESRRGLRTIQQAEQRQRLGPFSMLSAALFISAGVGLYFYFRYEKERMERKRIAEATKGVGKPKVGGHFELIDQDGQPWKSSEKMDGKYSLIYFGFSHCPDICPEELDKMASMLDIVAETIPSVRGNPELLPVFITCDPARDSPSVLKTYLQEFHPSLVGLTGTWEQIKGVCRLYRVYFSTPSGVKPGQDYLVDHSIYFYLMDPEGDFVEAIGRQHTAEQGAKLMIDHMSDWRGKIKRD